METIVAFLLRSDLDQAFSWGLQLSIEAGAWTNAKREAFERLVPNGVCDANGRQRIADHAAQRRSAVPGGQSNAQSSGQRLASLGGSAGGAVASSGSSGLTTQFNQLQLTGAAGPLFLAVAAASVALLINVGGRLVDMARSCSYMYRRRQQRQHATSSVVASEKPSAAWPAAEHACVSSSCAEAGAWCGAASTAAVAGACRATTTST